MSRSKGISKWSIFPILRGLAVVCFSLYVSGCASTRLQNYYESEPVGDRQSTEMDFKNSEELDKIGQQSGAQ